MSMCLRYWRWQFLNDLYKNDTLAMDRLILICRWLLVVHRKVMVIDEVVSTRQWGRFSWMQCISNFAVRIVFVSVVSHVR